MADSSSESSFHTITQENFGSNSVPPPNAMNESFNEGTPMETNIEEPTSPKELTELFMYLKTCHQWVKEYAEKTRPTQVNQMYALFGRITEVERSLDMVAPESRQALTVVIIASQKAKGLRAEQHLAKADKAWERYRTYLYEELNPSLWRNLKNSGRWLGKNSGLS